MSDVFSVLPQVAADRAADPLAPLTFAVPSHAAGLHLRRRLASFGPFAGVRFETLPRIAELLGAGSLAAAGRAPLARPIGDYVAGTVALEAGAPFGQVSDLPGFAKTLRAIFRRLRRAGITRSADVAAHRPQGHLGEMLRLYDRFRERTSAFYDAEDLLDAAADAVREGRTVASELGALYVVPPGPETAAGQRLLAALVDVVPVTVLDEPTAAPQQRFVISPDPGSEAAQVARLVLEALEDGAGLDSIAVFHGADRAYGALLREAFATAGIPAAPLPGVPLIETRAGRGTLLLASLPDKDYSRAAVFEFLTVAPLRPFLPAGDRAVAEAAASWDKLSRDAGVTHGSDVWASRLDSLRREREASLTGLEETADELQREIALAYLSRIEDLGAVVESLVARLDPLREEQPAEQFIARFKDAVNDYIAHDAEGYTEVIEEVDQLGTVGAVGGSFGLSSFTRALAANIEIRTRRLTSLGAGVVIADYRAAAGMRFDRVVLCGAYEGVFPAGPGADAIVDDAAWRELKAQFPLTEDAATRISRAREGATRAVAAAGDGILTWSVPAYEPGGGHEYYPSPLMAEAFSAVTGRRTSASELRRHAPVRGVLARALSPLATALRGPALSKAELDIRKAVMAAREGRPVAVGHPRHRALELLQARRSSAFSAWDGNVAGLPPEALIQLHQAVSPTSLEHYAACGFRYFCRSVLRLKVVEEPEDRDTMDAAARGSLVHAVLERFFREQKARGRPRVQERWTPADRERLLAIAREEFEEARSRGLTGLDIYAAHDLRTIQADLAQFLEADSAFRTETKAVPDSFEQEIPEQEIAGVRLRGTLDRIDRTEDGKKAWVIDYKTGSTRDYEGMTKDPLLGGRKLQLPTYLLAARDAEQAFALYWFVSLRGGFERISYEPTPEGEERFRRTLAAIVNGIQAGAFPAISQEENEFYNAFENCRFCDFDRICSRRRDLEFAAKQGDPAMAAWLGVRAAATPQEGQP